MKVLVTGGAGYIGSHVIRKLLARKHEVFVVDNFSTGHRESIPKEVRFLQADVSDSEKLESVFMDNRFDAVMHFAGFISVGESVQKPEMYFENNVTKAVKFLQQCLNHDVRKFIFSSSAAVYGTPKRIPIREDDDKNPESPYGDTKAAFEKFLDMYDKMRGLKYVSLRYFNAAGADDSGKIGESHDPETHLIPLVLQAASGMRKSVSVFGTNYETKDGTCVRDYVHVNDIAEAHILALESLRMDSKIYNIGSGSGYTVREIIDMCKKVTGKDFSVIEEQPRKGDPAFLIADSFRIKKELGWQPQYNLKRIIETAWNWHKNHPDGFS